MSRTLAQHRNRTQWHMSVECYTPPWLLGRIAAFLGTDYFDPCPARNGRPLEVNGLAIPWAGRVYCNPPYGRAIAPWIRKAVTEPVEEIILLIPAYTDAKWFAPLFSHSVCFVHGRLQFHKPGSNAHGHQSPHASALVYRGYRHQEFAEHFAEVGPTLINVWTRTRRDLWEQSA